MRFSTGNFQLDRICAICLQISYEYGDILKPKAWLSAVFHFFVIYISIGNSEIFKAINIYL